MQDEQPFSRPAVVRRKRGRRFDPQMHVVRRDLHLLDAQLQAYRLFLPQASKTLLYVCKGDLTPALGAPYQVVATVLDHHVSERPSALDHTPSAPQISYYLADSPSASGRWLSASFIVKEARSHLRDLTVRKASV